MRENDSNGGDMRENDSNGGDVRENDTKGGDVRENDTKGGDVRENDTKGGGMEWTPSRHCTDKGRSTRAARHPEPCRRRRAAGLHPPRLFDL